MGDGRPCRAPGLSVRNLAFTRVRWDATEPTLSRGVLTCPDLNFNGIILAAAFRTGCVGSKVEAERPDGNFQYSGKRQGWLGALGVVV